MKYTARAIIAPLKAGYTFRFLVFKGNVSPNIYVEARLQDYSTHRQKL
jgi:hypothetical protein